MLEFLKILLPYKISGKNNQVFIVKDGKKKKLRHRLKGLNIDIKGNNNYIEIELPFKFEKTTIKMYGDCIKFVLKKSNKTMLDTRFILESYAQVFIDEDSRFNTVNSHIYINNNRKNQPHKLVIGKGAQIGQDFYLRNSDGHSLFNIDEKLPYNEPHDIIIGDNVWFGTRCTVIKGAGIPSNTVVGACSVVNKSFSEENTILAGNPAKVIKRNIRWEYTNYGEFIDDVLNPPTATPKEVIIKKLKRKLIGHKISKIRSYFNRFRHR